MDREQASSRAEATPSAGGQASGQTPHTPFLRLDAVSKRFVSANALGLSRQVSWAVREVSLELAAGETLGLVGESGSGKSTVARMVCGLIPPTSGRILFEGRELHEPGMDKDLPGLVSMVFQDPFSSLNPRKTVGFSVAEGLLRVRGLSASQKRERVLELLGFVGLSPEHAERYPHQFSGGQRQRVAIARALASGARLLVCDEPVSALDVSIQAQVLNLFASLRESLGVSYLFISHDLAVVGHVSDRVAVMYQGRVVEVGPTDELFASPLHPYTELLLTARPGIRGKSPQAPRPPVSGAMQGPCAFAPRCPRADASCAGADLLLIEVAPKRFVACPKAAS